MAFTVAAEGFNAAGNPGRVGTVAFGGRIKNGGEISGKWLI
ncbi:hypothetical protein CfE428DRAFT_2737 [Chthoniobacter flavus Ellin428]|uniref:Uncharacterized protein n=1 Tax=Chthoniobacter flavus Ellin428 TaxID=497964 RepID=B4D1E9_9BACT|nr:hypothetical protein CfE428DRAFT_2737 [Chthoniobacter flavus Ellin428]TCO92805.1 hypothetical protein EV701_10582 [Chthoniobacter flavus]